MIHLAPGSQVPAWAEALETACFGDAWGDLDDLEHLWAEPGVGFARWQVVEAAGEAELIRIAVDPAHRRTGAGRRILAHSQAAIARLGVATAHLEVRLGNDAARRLYAAEGWRECGLRRAYYRDGEDAVLYVRTL
ncbi:GNAT family N-acetyltransferase [Mesoterricola sediminis]|uniref:N-acetyltransferase domain-containing protein n=1 Tax=Mesoterricola sediminis TaxID=2927980 RepID=A0AA48H1Q0_9BACT|nr:GNAT family N-acetyltransferase [Mesoterricola sediminis]BDU78017.1 hypothetical protein METESE_29750 [Mesoterricola sediminis]